MELLLREPDFTSAALLAAAINEVFTNSAHAVDSTSVLVQMPADADGAIRWISSRSWKTSKSRRTRRARIIINERTGTIVATSRIRISSCAVAHGNITINVASTTWKCRSRIRSASTGYDGRTPRTSTKVTESKSSLIALPEMPTVEKVASALNALGATPRDMMSIFQAMKQAGALQAELIVR